MLDRVTLEQMEKLVAQLPPLERLKLVAHICEQLSVTQIAESDKEKTRRERLVQVDAWLAECDTVAESIEGEFDSAEDIRQIREERANRL
ncbi:MAG: hypothetical protein HY731_03590 [Candidatus Tectomicrobia bacterium]|nr:hypothetical protein [Candidatus Tectomicrobia bacterium]